MRGLTVREEEYLNALGSLSSEKGYARIRDLADVLEVSPSSVIDMMKKFDERQLVSYQKYGYIKLREKGLMHIEALSRWSREYRSFLQIMNFPVDLDDVDLGYSDLDSLVDYKFRRFMKIINNPEEYPDESNYIQRRLKRSLRS